MYTFENLRKIVALLDLAIAEAEKESRLRFSRGRAEVDKRTRLVGNHLKLVWSKPGENGEK